MKEGIAAGEPPSTLKVFTSCYWGKHVLEKNINNVSPCKVLEKPLIFSQKILYKHVQEHFLYLVMTSAKNFKT